MTLREEILAGESAELEFKEARPKEALKYVKTAVAFANGRGGRLIFGVENETRKVIGVDPEAVFREVTDWTAADLPRPKLEETPGFFKVVFERKKSETVNEPVKMVVVQAVHKTPGIRRPN